MSLDRIRLAKNRTIGLNQTLKAMQQLAAREVYVARDAEPRVLQPVLQLAEQQGLSLVWVDSMRMLGKACGIEVGAATAAILD
ncbi:MAG: ribosomal L7Ae/L30e/S12e/Gadd45 family protein [Alicyclobacillaceae bacterium]|uniref:ribosomal L7Ae/L30e/S12e/Gadd45 family protein n=1 Tax=Alicyclobacillus sp. SP_1 TaxID=2942475 RepID=UPI002158805B|nr:ribosomal L7Ae/L30e/S12e/Gadd45 family protein [Alicyclobacillus sp. SP_1]MCY0887437.1 ribosomal L7Ae/L30e/S12e/Gadd45 family protein [Alicyclobacillaceae bacterium]MCY0895979.1 ribosomal L7Ae/L30e/S12e/Gadd45 family protein [Alicyclobacillaceae bacterium]